MKTGSRPDDKHFDGGASFVHGGLTLYGQRDLVIYCTDGTNVTVPCHPGHFYIGAMCAAEHQVLHSSVAVDSDLVRTEAHGGLQIVVLFRSRVFRASRGTSMATGPNPLEMYAKVLDQLNESLSRVHWELPSLADCLDVKDQ